MMDYALNTHPVCKERQIAFKGLTSQLSRRIYEQADTIQAMAAAYPNSKGRAGSLPSEFIAAMKRSGGDIREKIEIFFAGLSSAIRPLKNIDKAQMKALGELDIAALQKEAEAKFSEGPDAIGKFILSFNSARKVLSPEAIALFEKRSSSILTRAAKKAGILPKGAHAEVRLLGNGAHGNTYQISFLDKNGQKLYSDKVLKLYKDRNFSTQASLKLAKQAVREQKAMPMKKLQEKIKASFKVMCPDSGFSEAKIDEIALEAARVTKKTKFSEYKDSLAEGEKIVRNGHGVLAEPNRAMFIKRALGNLKETDVITPYVFDLKKGYGLVEMADESLPKVRRKVDAKKLGLQMVDIEGNPDNKLCDRIIDFGGMYKASN